MNHISELKFNSGIALAIIHPDVFGWNEGFFNHIQEISRWLDCGIDWLTLKDGTTSFKDAMKIANLHHHNSKKVYVFGGYTPMPIIPTGLMSASTLIFTVGKHQITVIKNRFGGKLNSNSMYIYGDEVLHQWRKIWK